MVQVVLPVQTGWKDQLALQVSQDQPALLVQTVWKGLLVQSQVLLGQVVQIAQYPDQLALQVLKEIPAQVVRQDRQVLYL
jgi:hypothetical protein